MSYFDDLTFLAADEAPRCRSYIKQGRFPHFALQLICASQDRAMVYAVNQQPLRTVTTPHWSWHHPAASYSYWPAPATGSWHHFWVACTGPRARALIEQGFAPLSSCGLLPVRDVELARSRFRRLVPLVVSGHHQAEAVLLLEACLAQALSETHEPSQPDLQRLAARIDANPGQDWDFQQEAAQRGWSYHHFRRRFRQALHCPPQAYVLTRRLQQAAADLRHGHDRIAAIAARAGYPDQAQFSRLFRQRFGCSPRRFRSGN